MEFHWMLPHDGAVKVNVHSATPFVPFLNGNLSGLGMIIRNSEGDLIKLSTGVLPSNSALENKLNAIHYGLIKAFDANFKEVIVETDNLDAFKIVKNFPQGIPPEVANGTRRIFIRANDPRWKCIVAYVFPGRNPIAVYLARLGGERYKQLFSFTSPIGAVEDLMSLDLGFGHAGNQFQDVEVYSDEEDPVDFGPNIVVPESVAFGGYAFKEDYHAVDNGTLEGPVVLPVHGVEMEDFFVGAGYHFSGTNFFSPLY